MPTAQINGITIYYEEHPPSADPASDPVLLTNGFNNNCATWQPQIPALSGRYRVVAFDNRGAGRSGQPDEPYTIPQMAEDAIGVLGHLRIDTAHIIGVSMGGMIAQELAIRHPRRVRSLVLISTTPGGPGSFGYADILEARSLLDGVEDLSTLYTPERVQEMLELLFTPEYLKSPGEGFQAMVVAQLQYPTTLPGMRGQSSAVLAHDTMDRLRQISAPTLVITGADDTMVDARNSQILAEQIPDAELQVFAGYRHGLIAEVPEVVNPVLLEFLGRHSVVGAARG